MGVFAGIRTAAMARLGSDNLEGLRVAIQGLGNVGFALAEQLHAAGAELLVSDIDTFIPVAHAPSAKALRMNMRRLLRALSR